MNVLSRIKPGTYILKSWRFARGFRRWAEDVHKYARVDCGLRKGQGRPQDKEISKHHRPVETRKKVVPHFSHIYTRFYFFINRKNCSKFKLHLDLHNFMLRDKCLQIIFQKRAKFLAPTKKRAFDDQLQNCDPWQATYREYVTLIGWMFFFLYTIFQTQGDIQMLL